MTHMLSLIRRRGRMLTALLAVLLLTACSHPTIGKLVGNDRDDHGCKGSAGYTWSYALHDCVRLWEVGKRFNEGPQQVFLVFSADSLFAEIFTEQEGSIICKRKKGTQTWKHTKGEETVSINNGITCVKVNNFTYTSAQ